MDDQHLDELIRQASTVTGVSTQATTSICNWLLDGGHVTRTGKSLQRPRQQPAPIAYAGDGSPVYAKGADFSTHETVPAPK